MTKRITIKTIAAELGISHMTVSRALSNHPLVNAKTREAVLAHARERGYVKSAAATAMRGDGTRILGLLLPNLLNEFYARFANALALACEQESLQLIIHLTNDGAEAEARALARLREVEAFAVAMVPVPGKDDLNPAGLKGMKAIQLIREKPLAEPCRAILADDGPAIAEAVRRLAQNRHRFIGYIGASTDLSTGRARLDAFARAMAAEGLPTDDRLMHTVAPAFESGRQAAAALLADAVATALVCGGVEISKGALSAYMDLPETARGRLAFIGYGDPHFYRFIDSGLSAIALDADLLARTALDMLLAPDGRATDRRRVEAVFVERHMPAAG